MKTTNWIAGVVMIGLGAGVASMAMANRGGPEPVSFATLDANSDGKVTQAELDAHKTARFTKADANKDGKLSKEELLANAKSRENARIDRRVGKMMGRMDADNDGLLSKAEMETMTRGKGLLARLDADKDGAITAEEFAAGKSRRGMGKHGGQHGGHGGQMQQKRMNNAAPATE